MASATLLDHLFGIQNRAGCSCAGPYGHRLLGIQRERSESYRRLIAERILGIKPGWVRLSLPYHFSRADIAPAEAITACMRALFAWQRRCAKKRGVDLHAPRRSQSARNAAVVFPQRFNSALALSFHVHALVADGVFERTKIPTRSRPDPDDPVTSIPAAASRRLPSPQVAATEPPPLCARKHGFSLHAAVAVHANDRAGLERLARYCARPALSPARMSLTDDGRVRYRMKRAFSDGRSEVVLEPRDFLIRLCALIPLPGRVRTRRQRSRSAHRPELIEGRQQAHAPVDRRR